jgi:hypothetical protein
MEIIGAFIFLLLILVYFKLKAINENLEGIYDFCYSIRADLRFIEGEISGRHKVEMAEENIEKNTSPDVAWDYMHDKYKNFHERYEKLRKKCE